VLPKDDDDDRDEDENAPAEDIMRPLEDDDIAEESMLLLATSIERFEATASLTRAPLSCK
jgi:hypothetical protein